MKPTADETKSQKDKIVKLLQCCDKAKQSTTKIPYQDVAIAFYGGPHPGYGNMILWNDFDPWTKTLGWKAHSEENTPHSDIIFERLTKAS